MAVDFISHSKMDDQMALQEAASAGLQNMEQLIYLLSHQAHAQNPLIFSEITGSTLAKFKKVISILNRTGHARFRRGSAAPVPVPAASESQSPPQTLTIDFSKPSPSPSPAGGIQPPAPAKESFTISPMSSGNSSFLSSVTGDGSVSNGKQGSSLLLPPAPAVSVGKPPLSSSYRKKCHGHSDDASGRCHCSKKRYDLLKSEARSPYLRQPRTLATTPAPMLIVRTLAKSCSSGLIVRWVAFPSLSTSHVSRVFLQKISREEHDKSSRDKF